MKKHEFTALYKLDGESDVETTWRVLTLKNCANRAEALKKFDDFIVKKNKCTVIEKILFETKKNKSRASKNNAK